MEIPTTILVGTTGTGKVENVSQQSTNNEFLIKIFMENRQLSEQLDKYKRELDVLKSENEMLKSQLVATETSTKEKTKNVVFVLGSQENTSEEVSDARDGIFADAEEETTVEKSDIASDVEETDVASDVEETDTASDTKETEYYDGILEKRKEGNEFKIFLLWNEEDEKDTIEVSSDDFAGFKGTNTEPLVSSGTKFPVKYKFDGENIFDIVFADRTFFKAFDPYYKNKFGELKVREEGRDKIFYVMVEGREVATKRNCGFNKPNIRAENFDINVHGTEVEVSLRKNYSGGTPMFAWRVYRADGMPW